MHLSKPFVRGESPRSASSTRRRVSGGSPRGRPSGIKRRPPIAEPARLPHEPRCAVKVRRGSPGRRSWWSSNRRWEWQPGAFRSCRASGSGRSCRTRSSGGSTPVPSTRISRSTVVSSSSSRETHTGTNGSARPSRRWWRVRPTRSSIEIGIPYWRPPHAAAYVATYGAARVNVEAAAGALYSGSRRGVEQSGSSPGS